MVRQPQSLADVKAMYREEKGKVLTGINTVIGSRVLMAVLATFVIAFGANLIYSPAELPSVGGLSLAQAGLPPVDFGFVGEQAREAGAAVQRQDATSQVQHFFAENARYNPIINAVGLGLSLALLALNMTIMTMRRRITRG